MAKAKRANQRTRKQIKHDEAKNSECTSRKPVPDRLPSSDGVNVICKVNTIFGGKRFGCEILNTQYLDIKKHQEVWNTPDLSVETELKAKLKGSIRNKSYSKVVIGKLVSISYGDTIDFSYTVEEAKWIHDNLIIKSEERGDVSFSNDTEQPTSNPEESKELDESKDKSSDESEDESEDESGINLDDI